MNWRILNKLLDQALIFKFHLINILDDLELPTRWCGIWSIYTFFDDAVNSIPISHCLQFPFVDASNIISILLYISRILGLLLSSNPVFLLLFISFTSIEIGGTSRFQGRAIDLRFQMLSASSEQWFQELWSRCLRVLGGPFSCWSCRIFYFFPLLLLERSLRLFEGLILLVMWLPRAKSCNHLAAIQPIEKSFSITPLIRLSLLLKKLFVRHRRAISWALTLIGLELIGSCAMFQNLLSEIHGCFLLSLQITDYLFLCLFFSFINHFRTIRLSMKILLVDVEYFIVVGALCFGRAQVGLASWWRGIP